MKVLWRYNTGTQVFRDIEEPQISEEDDVKIKVAYNTIGIQDMRMSREWDFYAKSGIAGYEMAGTIVALGKTAMAKGLFIGQRVTGTIVEFCGTCPYCLKGETNYCMDLNIHAGTLCEYVVWKAEQVVPIPEKMSFSMGTLIEPVAVVSMAANRLELKKDEQFCIFGGDFNGLVLLQIAKLIGVKDVTVIEQKSYNMELAKKLGADRVIDPSDDSMLTELMKITDFIGFTSVAVTSSNQEWIENAINIAAAGGRIVFTVYYDYDVSISINSVKLFKMGISLTSSLLYSKEILQDAPGLLEKLDLTGLIAEEYPFSKSIEAFEKEKKMMFPRIGIIL